jgi:hypothetical protein
MRKKFIHFCSDRDNRVVQGTMVTPFLGLAGFPFPDLLVGPRRISLISSKLYDKANASGSPLSVVEVAAIAVAGAVAVAEVVVAVVGEVEKLLLLLPGFKALAGDDDKTLVGGRVFCFFFLGNTSKGSTKGLVPTG